MASERYLWPPKVTISFYDRHGFFMEDSRARDLDLSDTLMLHWRKPSRTVRMSMSTQSVRWPVWTEKALRKVEALIRYDLSFDGDDVTLKRLTEPGIAGTSAFFWLLRIREPRARDEPPAQPHGSR